MGKQSKQTSALPFVEYSAESEDEFPDPFPHSVENLVVLLVEREKATGSSSLDRQMFDHSWPNTCANVVRLRKGIEADFLVWSSSTLADEIERLQTAGQKEAGELSVDEFKDAWLAMGVESGTAAATPRPTIVSHGDQCYSIDGCDPYRVSEREDWVLQSFIGIAALSLKELERKSGAGNPHEVLKGLADPNKYDGRFTPAIRRPGGKGGGGYAVSIKNSQ